MTLEDRSSEGLRIKMFKELVDIAGGVEMAVRKLAERDVPAVDTAIQLLGGRRKAAGKLGMTDSNLWKMLQKPPVDWNGRWIKALAERSGVPVDQLLNSPVSELGRQQPELTVVQPQPAPKKRDKKVR